jgi:hypothetical protein
MRTALPSLSRSTRMLGLVKIDMKTPASNASQRVWNAFAFRVIVLPEPLAGARSRG